MNKRSTICFYFKEFQPIAYTPDYCSLSSDQTPIDKRDFINWAN